MKMLTHGSILIVGTKASNFGDDIKNHPRVALWDNEKWNPGTRDLPVNTRAVFFTRWVGHSFFKSIVTEARKKRITIFTPQGTGAIARQVKELLGINGVKEEKIIPKEPCGPTLTMFPVTVTKEEIKTMTTERTRGKLTPLIQFINFAKTDRENGTILFQKAQELGIMSTPRSLANLVSNQRKKAKEPKTVEASTAELDVSLDILDNAIKSLKDVREYLLSTVKENTSLRARISKFKKALGD